MAILLADVEKYVTSMLSADSTFAYTTSNSNRHISAEIQAAILSNDGRICSAIASMPSHPQRFNFLTTSTVSASGNTLPVSTGGIAYVTVNSIRADQAPAELIKYWNDNAIDKSDRFYDTVGGKLYYNGTGSATVYLYKYTRTSACQAPDEYFGVVANLTLADMYAKEGDDLGASQVFTQKAERELQLMNEPYLAAVIGATKVR